MQSSQHHTKVLQSTDYTPAYHPHPASTLPDPSAPSLFEKALLAKSLLPPLVQHCQMLPAPAQHQLPALQLFPEGLLHRPLMQLRSGHLLHRLSQLQLQAKARGQLQLPAMQLMQLLGWLHPQRLLRKLHLQMQLCPRRRGWPLQLTQPSRVTGLQMVALDRLGCLQWQMLWRLVREKLLYQVCHF